MGPRKEVVAGDTELEAEASPAVMGPAWRGVGVDRALESGGEVSGNTVFSGNRSSCYKNWLLASEKLPYSELHGLGAGTFPVQSVRGPRLCEDLPLARWRGAAGRPP